MVVRVCAARPGALRSGCGISLSGPRCGSLARAASRDGAASVRRWVPLRTGGAKLRIFTMRKCSGRAIFRTRRHGRRGPGETEDGKKSGGRFRLSSVSCGSAALPGPLACSARCGGLPFVRRTLRSRSGFPVLCATLEALRRLSGRVRRRGFAAGVWVRRRGSAAAFPAGHRRARRSWRSVELSPS